MSVILQDPNSPTCKTLLSELHEHLQDAEIIRCAFAFVTAKGVSLLFGEEGVSKNLENASTELIVGMDAITDTKAVQQFKNLCKEFPKVSVRMFLPGKGGIFHPKISWVKIGSTGIVVAGSGNLTTGGLENNVEAFSVEKVSAKGLAEITKSWDEFLANNAAYLFDLESPEVTKAAEENKKLKKAFKKAKKEVGRTSGEDDVPDNGKIIFVEELTEGRGGKQRDVGKWAAENYFMNESTINLTYVDSRGIRRIEPTKTLSFKKSKNFAVDLDASAGVGALDGSLPIAVFVKTAPHNYLYHVLAPDSIDYNAVSGYLRAAVAFPGEHKARRLKKALTPDELLAFWPTAPFWE